MSGPICRDDVECGYSDEFRKWWAEMLAQWEADHLAALDAASKPKS